MNTILNNLVNSAPSIDETNLSSIQAMTELNVTEQELCAMGILVKIEVTDKNVNPFNLAPIGSLFFTERFPELLISQTKLKSLKLAINSWDDFTVLLEGTKSTSISGEVSVNRQRTVTYQINKLETLASPHLIKSSIDSGHLRNPNFYSERNTPINIWNDFCQCVQLIENTTSSPTNIELACNADMLNQHSEFWHPSVQSYFQCEMYKIGFQQNLYNMQEEIESQSPSSNSVNWSALPVYFSQVRRISRDSVNNDLVVTANNETIIDFAELNSIDKSGVVDKRHVKTMSRYMSLMYNLTAIKHGDVLLSKNKEDESVDIAYYSFETTKTVYADSEFVVLRANQSNGHWTGKYLFLFLQTSAGKKFLEYVLQDFTKVQRVRPNRQRMPTINERQLNLLELPDLTDNQAAVLDERFLDIIDQNDKLKELEYKINHTLSLSVLS